MIALVFVLVFGSCLPAQVSGVDSDSCTLKEICRGLESQARVVYTGHVTETRCNCFFKKGGNSKLLLCLRITLPAQNQTKSVAEAAIKSCPSPPSVPSTPHGQDMTSLSCDSVIHVVNDKSYQHHNLYALNKTDDGWSFCHGLWEGCDLSSEKDTGMVYSGCDYTLETIEAYSSTVIAIPSETTQFLNMSQTMLHNGEKYLVNGDHLCKGLNPLHLLADVPAMVLKVLENTMLCEKEDETKASEDSTEEDKDLELIVSAVTKTSTGCSLSQSLLSSLLACLFFSLSLNQ